MADQGHALGQGGELTDMDALRVGPVQPDAAGYPRMIADVHAVDRAIPPQGELYDTLAKHEVPDLGYHENS